MTCDAKSIYCQEDVCWTFSCQAADDHAPGEHDYVVDPGQDPIPED